MVRENEASVSNLSRPELITDKILYLDGLSRSGKFLLGKIVSNLRSIEYFQYEPILEHLPILNYLNIMSDIDAIAYFRLSLNMFVYNRSIGRNMNLRPDDGSCLRNSSEYKFLNDRMFKPDGLEALQVFNAEEKYSAFLIHECLPHIEFLINATPHMKMINIQRHPVDTAFSWCKKKWGERFGVDPLVFAPTVDFNEGSAPWFAEDWQEKYLTSLPVDRVINSICALHQLEKNASFLPSLLENVLFISYEYLVFTPYDVICQMSDFLDAEPFPNMEEILLREGCFRPLDAEERRKKFLVLGETASPDSIKKLIDISREYEAAWELSSFL